MWRCSVIESVQRTALVTGASGSIGRRLSERLKEEGWIVVGLSSKRPGDGIWDEYLEVDLAKKDAISKAAVSLKGYRISVVWHLAGNAHALDELGQDKSEYDRVNVDGTRHTLSLARQLDVPRFVLASSVKAMGEGEIAIQDESSKCNPSSAYGRSKLSAEKLVLSTGAILEPVVLRFCMVYGGGNDRDNMGKMMVALKRGRFPPFPETGNRRSFVHIEDAVQACLLAGSKKQAIGQVFLVTDGQLHSTRDLYLTMRESLGLPKPAFTPPLWLFTVAAVFGDLLSRVINRRLPLDTDTLSKLTNSAAYSSKNITQKLGYLPEWPLAKGLAALTSHVVVQKKRKR